MYPGPGGASGFVNGSSASHSRNAVAYAGVNRFSSIACSSRSPASWAWSQAVKNDASATSSWPPNVEAASASNRVDDASP